MRKQNTMMVAVEYCNTKTKMLKRTFYGSGNVEDYQRKMLLGSFHYKNISTPVDIYPIKVP